MPSQPGDPENPFHGDDGPERLDDAAAGAVRQPPQAPSGGAPRPARCGRGPYPFRPLLALVASQVVQAAALGALSLAAPAEPGPGLRVGALALSTIPATLAVVALWPLLSGLPLAALGYRAGGSPGRDVARGAISGLGAIGLVVAVGALLGAYRIEASVPPALFWPAALLPLLLFAAHFEEVLVRGWFLQDLGRGAPLRGLVMSSLAFALLHAGNPGAWAHGPVFALQTFLVLTLSGLWLGSLFLRTGALWSPTAAHLAWNWVQGPLLGLPVSGLPMPSLLVTRVAPDTSAWAGGAFGPESSVLAALVLAGLAAHGIAAVARTRAPLPVDAWDPAACGRGNVSAPPPPSS